MLKLVTYFTVVAVVNIVFVETASKASDQDIHNLLVRLKQKIQQEQERFAPEKHEQERYVQEKQNRYQPQKKVHYASEKNRYEQDIQKLIEDVEEDGAGVFGSIGAKELSQLLGKKYSSDESGSYNIHGPDIENYLLSRPQLPDGNLDDIANDNDVNSVQSSSEENADEDNPNGYSKVYVVLNSDAIKTMKNKDKLNKLLSSLLSSPDREQEPEYRYKGFVVNENSLNRRISHDEANMFEKDIMPEKKHLRPRTESRDVGGVRGKSRGSSGGRGGGGGGGGRYFEGLRTPIPYIHHRDDNIYEKQRN